MAISNGREDPLFGGKIVIVYLANPPVDYVGGITISDPEIKQICGKTFLFGIVPTSMLDWTSGLRAGISIEQIAHFLEFKDEREYLDKISIANKMNMKVVQ